MSLEKDLHQSKPFKSELERTMVNIFFTSRYIETKMQAVHKKNGITMKQFNILRILRGAGKPISTQTIRKRMIDRMSDISRIVDRMIDKNLVSKCVNHCDKRLVDITITEVGLKTLESLSAIVKQEIEALGTLTESEAKQLNKLLDKVRGHK